MALSEPSKSIASLDLKLVEAGNVKNKQYAIIQGFPCRVCSVLISAPGKHGAAKANITGIHVLNGRKYTFIGPSDSRLYSFKVDKSDQTVVDVQKENGCAQFLDEKNNLQTIDLSPNQCQELTKLMINSDANVTMKVIRVPQVIDPKAPTPEFTAIQAVDSFSLAK